MNSFKYRSQGATKQSFHRAGWLIALTGFVILGFAGICANVLLDMRRSDWELARQTSENIVATIEADISRNLELYDLSLQAVVDGMKLPEINQINKHLRQLVLFDRSATAKHLGAIQIMDQEGRVTLNSAMLDPLPYNNAQEDYFSVHKRDANVGLFISRPVMKEDGEHVLVVSRRLMQADRSFAGVVAGSIRLSYFQDLFARVAIDAEGTLTLMRRDGTILMRSPYDVASIGRNVGHTTLSKKMMTQDRGFAEGTGIIDGIERLYVWHVGKKDQLVVGAGRSLTSMYSRWRAEAIRIGTSVFALIVLAAGLAIWLARELIRRTAAEARLTEMAMTDGLTGINNRRRFDEVLATEWQHSIRQSTPIAVLMIDADNFKLFNDKFGHQAGDEALIKLASCIRAGIREGAGDHAARYGGEEFAVLLPGLSESQAFIVGERIRNRVKDTGETRDMVTVSIGVASVLPSADVAPSKLVAQADAALYRAKSDGRNQTYPAPQQAGSICGIARSAEIIKLAR